MRLVICRNAHGAAMQLADLIEDRVRSEPKLNLGLATGRTSAGAYEALVRRHNACTDFTFRHVSTFNTDEFVGLKPWDSRSTRFFMNYRLFKHVDIPLENTMVPRGDAVDVESEAKAYELLIKARGGLDIAVLGLGHNGHVGFNEPGSSAKSRTREVEFTESTLAALSDGNRFQSLNETPRKALTMGLATFYEARHVLLIATGIGKANAVHRVFDGKPGPSVPASLLMDHPNLTVIVDQDAASTLRKPPQDTVHV